MFAITIVFIIVITILILYPFDLSGKDINEIQKENSGLIWLLTTVIIIVIAAFEYFNFQIVSVVKQLSKDNEEKNKIIIENQKDYLSRIEELIESINNLDRLYIEKWDKVTSDIRSINNRLDSHSEKIAKLEG